MEKCGKVQYGIPTPVACILRSIVQRPFQTQCGRNKLWTLVAGATIWFDNRPLPSSLRLYSYVEAIPQHINHMRPVIVYAKPFQNSFQLVDIKWCRYLPWIRRVAYKKLLHDIWLGTGCRRGGALGSELTTELSPRSIETEVGFLGADQRGNAILMTTLRKMNPPRGWSLCTVSRQSAPKRL